MLGADLSSAVVAQVLSVRQTWLIPDLLVSGVALFLRGRARRIRQSGGILIGLALTLVSLDMLRAATSPQLESEGALNVLSYLETNLFAAFALGAIFGRVGAVSTTKTPSRVRNRFAESIETRNFHQETLRVMKQVNTTFAMVGYPILTETGDLLESRLSEGEKCRVVIANVSALFGVSLKFVR